jgi:hypothetical protein
VLGAVMLSSPVLAQETPAPVERPAKWADAGAGSLFLQGGWGFGTDDDEGFGDANEPSSAYAVGLGVKGGYTFAFKLYLGARFGYYFGRDGYERFYPSNGVRASNGIYEIGAEGGDITQSQQVTYLGTEVGYDFVIGPVVIRPYLADGILLHSDRECWPDGCESSSANEPFIGLGGSVFGVIGPLLVGLDSTFIAPLNEAALNAGLLSIIAGLQLPP